jgi:hypothetical protein
MFPNSTAKKGFAIAGGPGQDDCAAQRVSLETLPHLLFVRMSEKNLRDPGLSRPAPQIFVV